MSAMFRPDVTLVTYTYNDAHHTEALLASVPQWSVLPRRVIVVDDGSDVPFTTEWKDLPISIIRLHENRGRTEAKRTGLNAVESRFILSMDNDVRLAPEWLKVCLPIAAMPDVAIASTPLHHASGTLPVARYLAHTYSLQLNVSGDVSFISGGVWLLRSAVWRDVGGFGEYADAYGEDACFCGRILDAGLRLVLTTDSEASEVRGLPRDALIKRGWRWQGFHLKAALDEGRPVDEACNVLIYSMQGRLARARKADVLFLYFDLLYVVYALTDIIRYAGETNPDTAQYCDAPYHAALHLLREYPRLRELLVEDLARLGLSEPEGTRGRGILDFGVLLHPAFCHDDCAVMEASVHALRQE